MAGGELGCQQLSDRGMEREECRSEGEDDEDGGCGGGDCRGAVVVSVI